MGSSDDCTITKDEGSTEEEEDNNERNTGSSDFVVSSPNDDQQGGIESAIGGCDAQCEACIGRDDLLS